MKKLLFTWISCLAFGSLSAAEFTLQVKDALGLPAGYAEIQVNDAYYRTDAQGEVLISNLEEAGTYPITYRTAEEQQVEVSFVYSGGTAPQSVTMADRCLMLVFTGLPEGEEAWNKELSVDLTTDGGMTSYAQLQDSEGWGLWTSSTSFIYRVYSSYYGMTQGSLSMGATSGICPIDLTAGKKSVCLLPALDAEGNMLENGSYISDSNSYSFSDLKERGPLHLYYAPEDEASFLQRLMVHAQGIPYHERILPEEKDGEQTVVLDMADCYRLDVQVTGQDGKPLVAAGIYTERANDPEGYENCLMGQTDAQGKAVLLLPKNLVYYDQFSLWILPDDPNTSCVELCLLEQLDGDRQITKDLSAYRNYTLTLKNVAPLIEESAGDIWESIRLERGNYAQALYREMRMTLQGNDLLVAYTYDPSGENEGTRFYFMSGGRNMVSWTGESFGIEDHHAEEVDYALRKQVTLHSPEGLAVSLFRLENLNSYLLLDDRATVSFYAFPGTYTYTVTPRDLATGNVLKESGELQLLVGDQDVEETYPYTITQQPVTFHVRDIQGQPAPDFRIHTSRNEVMTDAEGTAVLYAEAGETLTFQISDYEQYYLPLDSSLLVGEEPMEITLDFSKLYHTVTLGYRGLSGTPIVSYTLNNEQTGARVYRVSEGNIVFYAPDGPYYSEIDGYMDGIHFEDHMTFNVDGQDVEQTYDFSGYGTLSFDYIENEAAMGGAEIYVTPIVQGVPGETRLYSYFLPKGTYYVTAEANLSDYQGEVGDEIGYHLFLCNRKVEIEVGENVHLTFDFSDLSRFDRVTPQVIGAPEDWTEGSYRIDGMPAFENQLMYLEEGEHFYRLSNLAKENLMRILQILPKAEAFTHEPGTSTVVMDLSAYAFPYLKQAQTETPLSGDLTLTHESGRQLTYWLTSSAKWAGLQTGAYTATLVCDEGDVYTTSFRIDDTEVSEVILNFVATGMESLEGTASALTYQNQALTVHTASPSARLTVFEVTGRQVMSRQVTHGETVSVEGLTQGIYIATLTDRNGTRTLKFARP